MPAASIDSVAESKVPGFYRGGAAGPVVYVSADGQFLIRFGVDIPNKTDLTEQARGGLRRTALAAVGPEQRIIYKAPNEKYAITVFTDIDCGYRRRMHRNPRVQQARHLDRIPVLPRAGIGSESYDKAVSVWCADDRNKAMDDAKA